MTKVSHLRSLSGLLNVAVGMFLMVGAASVQATPIQTTGSGSAVTTADFFADFDSLVQGQNPNISEGGFDVSPLFSASIVCQGGNLCNNHIGFAGMSGGIYYNSSFGATFTGSNDETMFGFEVMLGTGFGQTSLHAVWETYRDNVQTGSGVLDTAVGTIIGLSDMSGFDEVRIGTYLSSCSNTVLTPTCSAASAFDNASAQISSVPEPGMLALLLFGLAGIRLSRRNAQ